MENLKLAWRNLWRNKRRTLITVASVFAAIFFAIIMRSVQLGSYGHMFKNAIETYTGYIQIQQEDFWDDRTIDNVFEHTEELDKIALSDKNVEATIQRFESFALASNGPQTKGVMVLGIDPIKENLLSKIEDRVVKYHLTEEAISKISAEDIPEKVKTNLAVFKDHYYSNTARLQLDLGIKDDEIDKLKTFFDKYAGFKNHYIQKGEPGVLIGLSLAQYLKLDIGDTIILYGQGYHGFTAAGKFPINGYIKLPTQEMESQVVYLPLDICQTLYSAPNMISSLTLHVNNTSDEAIASTTSRIQEAVGSNLRVMEWHEMNKLMVQQMDADNKSGMIMIAILYMVIAFGVFGTVLMMTAERKREFGVLVAIGMQKKKLASVMSLEMLFMGLVGIISGILASVPVVLLGYYNPIRFSGEMGKMFEDYGMEPIMPFLWFDTYYFWQAVVVLFIVFISIVYPVRKIMTLKVINALRA